jgi:hypothetical protein
LIANALDKQIAQQRKPADLTARVSKNSASPMTDGRSLRHGALENKFSRKFFNQTIAGPDNLRHLQDHHEQT